MCGHQPSALRHRNSEIEAQVKQRPNQRGKFAPPPGANLMLWAAFVLSPFYLCVVRIFISLIWFNGDTRVPTNPPPLPQYFDLLKLSEVLKSRGHLRGKRKGGHLVGDTRRWRKGKRKESRDINVKWMNFFKTRQDTLNRQRERGIDILRLFLGTLR